jgi:hypothetical protein
MYTEFYYSSVAWKMITVPAQNTGLIILLAHRTHQTNIYFVEQKFVYVSIPINSSLK